MMNERKTHGSGAGSALPSNIVDDLYLPPPGFETPSTLHEAGIKTTRRAITDLAQSNDGKSGHGPSAMDQDFSDDGEGVEIELGAPLVEEPTDTIPCPPEFAPDQMIDADLKTAIDTIVIRHLPMLSEGITPSEKAEVLAEAFMPKLNSRLEQYTFDISLPEMSVKVRRLLVHNITTALEGIPSNQGAGLLMRLRETVMRAIEDTVKSLHSILAIPYVPQSFAEVVTSMLAEEVELDLDEEGG